MNAVKSCGMMKPLIRSYYSMESRPVNNLGDILGPHILDALGYAYAPLTAPDAGVVNPGRCLLVVGSLLTARKLKDFPWPMDVWGCGWKGRELAAGISGDFRWLAVRGPETASGFGLPSTTPLGDPALLLPHLIQLPVTRHNRTIVIPHMDRLKSMHASDRCLETGCAEALSTVVCPPNIGQLWRRSLPRESAGLFYRRVRYGVRVRGLWSTVSRIAGAAFVLTGSLHGAILAQAYGVPWAAYDDGYVDAPAKWQDWAAYLGIEIDHVKTLEAGRRWWEKTGARGRIRSLRPLLKSFPYPILSLNARRLIEDLP